MPTDDPRAIAAALRQAADLLDNLDTLPQLISPKLILQPWGGKDSTSIESLDLLGSALLDETGAREPMTDRPVVFYCIDGEIGPVEVSGYTRVASTVEEWDELHAGERRRRHVKNGCRSGHVCRLMRADCPAGGAAPANPREDVDA